MIAWPAWSAVRGFVAGIPREVWYALVLALAAWWAYDTVYDRGAASRDVEVAGLTMLLDAERSANGSNLETIAKLVAENTAWADAAKVQRATAEKAIAAVAGQRDALARELAQRRKDRGKIYDEDAEAAAWGRARVPDRIADQLRE